jgi:hypothetical protein
MGDIPFSAIWGRSNVYVSVFDSCGLRGLDHHLVRQRPVCEGRQGRKRFAGHAIAHKRYQQAKRRSELEILSWQQALARTVALSWPAI